MKLRDFIPQWFRRGAQVANSPQVVYVPTDTVSASYEAARWSMDRSWLPGFVADARQDIDSGQLNELRRKCRYFEKNNGHFQKILDLIETNVVGAGITPTPQSKNQKYNAASLKWFKKWSRYADLTSRQTLEALEAIIVRAQAVDGEMFIYMTFGETGRPRLQLIEAHRVISANLPKYKEEGYQDVDGILLDARGRPQFYVVGQDADAFSTNKPTTVAVIPATQIIHAFEPSRAGQYRGLPIAHAVLHDLHDLDDLQKYEMLAAKDASSRANIVYTENGELPNTGGPIGQSLRTATTPTDDRQSFYEKAFGAKTVALRRGDKWDQAESQRPSAAMREFWEYLENKICKGIGISYAAVCDYSQKWGGAALRGVVVADNSFYDIRTRSLAGCMQRVWEFAVGWALDNSEIVDEDGNIIEKPDDWNEVSWQPPRRATVDVGYDSAAQINELKAGLTTLQIIAAQRGLDWRSDLVDQRAVEEAYIDQQAKEKKVERQRISSLDANERAQAAAAKAESEKPQPAKELKPAA